MGCLGYEQLIRSLLLISTLSSSFGGAASMRQMDDSGRIRQEMEKSLRTELLDVWYPLSVDTAYGGFLCDFDYAWRPAGSQNKMIVSQTRHLWTTSQAAMYYEEKKFRRLAEHGFEFLREKMWDETYGGFFWLRNREGGEFSDSRGEAKTAYGNAFAIYALASYYAMSQDSPALALARETFLWLDKHSRDSEHGGYIDRMTRAGSWLSQSNGQAATAAPVSRWKDYNSSIHLLEAFTELYHVWPDTLLRTRLLEMLALIRDVFTSERGYLTLYFERDWTPVSFRDSSAAVREANFYYDHVSFGHDIETAYLMLEASRALELESDDRTRMVAKRMVDHALANGWDSDTGGFYYQGYYFTDSDSIAIIDESKAWWVQAEGLNALLLMAKMFPEEKKYYDAFKQQWAYGTRYLIDHEHGGWYEEGLDNSPLQVTAPKARDWKVNYHNTRALLNCIQMLN